jgi:hypothetical protein
MFEMTSAIANKRYKELVPFDLRKKLRTKNPDNSHWFPLPHTVLYNRETELGVSMTTQILLSEAGKSNLSVLF